jgi:hypothetical protein
VYPDRTKSGNYQQNSLIGKPLNQKRVGAFASTKKCLYTLYEHAENGESIPRFLVILADGKNTGIIDNDGKVALSRLQQIRPQKHRRRGVARVRGLRAAG